MFGCIGKDEKQWGLKSLKDCVEVNPQKSKDPLILSNSIEEVSFVPMAFVGENGSIDCSCIKNYDEVKSGFTYFKENDVLFAKITPCMENGKGCIAKGLHNGIGFGSTEFHVLRPLDNLCNPKWLYYVSTSQEMRRSAEKKMTGSAGQRRVPAKFLEDFKISIPPIELQKQFATFVSQVDKSKFLLQQMIAKLELLKKSRFIEMFEKEKYPVVNLEELIDKNIETAKKDFSKESIIKYIDISSIDNVNHRIIGYNEFVLSDAPSRAQQHIRFNDILVSTVRPNLKNVARVELKDSNLVASSGFCVLRPKKCSSEYLLSIVKSDKFTLDMSQAVSGATYPAIKDSDIYNYKIKYPPKEIQNAFSLFVKQLDKSKAILQKQLDDLVGSNKY